MIGVPPLVAMLALAASCSGEAGSASGAGAMVSSAPAGGAVASADSGSLADRSSRQGFPLSDDFGDGLCIGACAGAVWALTQEIEGQVAVDQGTLRARAGPRGSVVPKAALIARPGRMADGDTLDISFRMRVPEGVPLNSIHLLDIECAECGVPGNPGIRLYLRDGRLRIDRSKIGVEHAWTNGSAPQLANGRWHHVRVRVHLASDDAGGAQVWLDDAPVLEGRGRTLLAGTGRFADRIQFGITATSNTVGVAAQFDDFLADLR